jgi:hypothetical protein
MPGQDLQRGDSEPGGRMSRQYVSTRPDMDERHQGRESDGRGQCEGDESHGIPGSVIRYCGSAGLASTGVEGDAIKLG